MRKSILVSMLVLLLVQPAFAVYCKTDVVLRDGYMDVIVGNESVKINSLSVLAALIEASETCGLNLSIVQTSWGPYVNGIGGVESQGMAGWMYSVNGELPSVGVANFTLNDGDEIIFFYGEWGVLPDNAEHKIIINVIISNVEFYDCINKNGKIDDIELLKAIMDWLDGYIGDPVLIEIILEWI